MKKFCFSLEKVLDYKQQTLDVMKSEYAVLQMKLRGIIEKIDSMNQQYSDINAEAHTAMQQGIPVGDIGVYKTYLDTLNRKTQNQIKIQKQMEKSLEQKKQEILVIKTEISGLEKLKDNQQKEYHKAVQKAQETAIEEFVSHARCC